jgi:hypothetical protein
MSTKKCCLQNIAKCVITYQVRQPVSRGLYAHGLLVVWQLALQPTLQSAFSSKECMKEQCLFRQHRRAPVK